MTPTDITFFKALTGFALGKMLATPISAIMMGAGFPWLSGYVLHKIAIAFDEIATILRM